MSVFSVGLRRSLCPVKRLLTSQSGCDHRLRSTAVWCLCVVDDSKVAKMVILHMAVLCIGSLILFSYS
jgi:diphthamide synthase subunit DPH2